MGISSEHIVGRNQKFFVKKETSAGTFIKPIATDAMAVLTTSMVPNIMRKDRTDAYQASRDVIERITGKSEYSWAVDAYYVPSGTKNVAPNCGPFLEALFGTETVNANDVTYSQSSSQTLNTLSLVRHFQDFYMGTMWGCLVDGMTFKMAGGEEPKIHFEGRGMGYTPTGFSTLNGAMAASTTMIVQTVDANMFDVNSVVKIGSDDNSGAGYKVTVSSAAPSFTIEAAATASNSDPVIPFVPTWTDAGVPMTGITGSLTWDSLAFVITSFELSVKAGLKFHDDTAYQQNLSDAVPGFFEITGQIGLRMRKDHIIKLVDRKAFATKALAVVGGGAAQSGTRVEIDLGQCEMEFAEVAVPEAEEATVTIPFKALGSSGNDAITWKHT
jgi:hypothetical protein